MTAGPTVVNNTIQYKPTSGTGVTLTVQFTGTGTNGISVKVTKDSTPGAAPVLVFTTPPATQTKPLDASQSYHITITRADGSVITPRPSTTPYSFSADAGGGNVIVIVMTEKPLNAA